MLFKDETTMVWCQGTVVQFIRELKDKYAILVEWDEKCLNLWDPKVMRKELKKDKWNPDQPEKGARREDLHQNY